MESQQDCLVERPCSVRDKGNLEIVGLDTGWALGPSTGLGAEAEGDEIK